MSQTASADVVARGKQLFFDDTLSKTGRLSCASCHDPNAGWAGAAALARRADGVMNTRHAPTLFNVGYQPRFGWNGSDVTLESRVERELGGQLGVQHPKPEVIAALAGFVRTIRSGDAPWDRHEQGDHGAVGDAARRGWIVFRRTAACSACHVPPLFTDHKLHNAGVAGELLRFKTPPLRSLSSRRPLLHDGSAPDLDAAVDFMLGGGRPNPRLDSGLTKIELTPEQRADLMAFLAALNPD
jgi:cytochrome c peroxidase